MAYPWPTGSKRGESWIGKVEEQLLLEGDRVQDAEERSAEKYPRCDKGNDKGCGAKVP